MGVSIINGKLNVTKSFSHQIQELIFISSDQRGSSGVELIDSFSESIRSIPI